MEFSALTLASIVASALAAFAYGVHFRKRAPSLIGALVKALFMGALIVAFRDAHPALRLALMLAAAGDFLLALEDKPWALPLGMLAFLGMQLMYIAVFFGLWMLAPDGAPLWPRYGLMGACVLAIGLYLSWFWRGADQAVKAPPAAVAVIGALTLGAAPLVAAGIGYGTSFDARAEWGGLETGAFAGVMLLCALAVWLRRDLGAIKLAAMIYAAVIAQMALISFWLPWAGWPAMLGAWLFLISDALISAELFRMAPDAPARRWSGAAVWWSYVGAQALIVTGIVLARQVLV